MHVRHHYMRIFVRRHPIGSHRETRQQSSKRPGTMREDAYSLAHHSMRCAHLSGCLPPFSVEDVKACAYDDGATHKRVQAGNFAKHQIAKDNNPDQL